MILCYYCLYSVYTILQVWVTTCGGMNRSALTLVLLYALVFHENFLNIFVTLKSQNKILCVFIADHILCMHSYDYGQ